MKFLQKLGQKQKKKKKCFTNIMRSIHLTKHSASHLWSIHVIVKNSILDIGKHYNRCEQAIIYKSDVILIKQV